MGQGQVIIWSMTDHSCSDDSLKSNTPIRSPARACPLNLSTLLLYFGLLRPSTTTAIANAATLITVTTLPKRHDATAD